MTSSDVSVGHDLRNPEHLERCEACRITTAALEYRRSVSWSKWHSGVYFIRVEQFVKIGYSEDVRHRFRQLRSAMPFTVEPLGFIQCDTLEAAKALEAQLHERFRHLVSVRREWFRDHPSIRTFVRESAQLWPAPKGSIAGAVVVPR
jgi:hypothetical protein